MLQEQIEKLYQVFQIYPLNPAIHKCDCGCIPEDEGSKIYSKPLRKLTEDDLNFYSTKAMTTWGDLEDYKHFLPRILELFAVDKNNDGLDLDEIINKLKYGNWETWPIDERQAIIQIIRSTWLNYVNQKKSEICKFDFEAFSFVLSFKEMMELWKPSVNPLGLKNFVHFFYFNGNELESVFRILNIEIEEIERNFHSFFKRENLNEVLEKEFFKVEKKDPEYAEKVSIVLQMIETF